MTQFLLSLCFWLSSCGMTGGSASVPNDPRPSGNPLVQGQVFGQNGQSASGTAFVFYSQNVYILRFEGLSVPSVSGLVVQVFTASQGQVGNFNLKASSGNQNYQLTVQQLGIIFRSISIFSTQSNENYATALFN